MEFHRLHQTTNLADRSRFVWMWAGGMSARAIAQETGASVTTICRWIRRWRREGHVNTKPRRGRPRKNRIYVMENIHSHIVPFIQDVPSARTAETQLSENSPFSQTPTQVFPLNCLSSLMNLFYLQNVNTTVSHQFPYTYSYGKSDEVIDPLFSPDLD